MDEKAEVTTEVQIRKSRSYLPYLRRIVSRIGSGLGMTHKYIEETERAISEVCSDSMDIASAQQDDSLSIKLRTQKDWMMIEITDPSAAFGSACLDGWFGGSEHPRILERIHHLADVVELIRGGESATVRIIKYAEKPEMIPVASTPCLATAGTTSLQS